MKRKFTCILGGEGMPHVETMGTRKEVERWISENIVEQHRSAVLAGQLIHQADNGQWAIIVAGPRCGLVERKKVKLLTPDKMEGESDLQLGLNGVE